MHTRMSSRSQHALNCCQLLAAKVVRTSAASCAMQETNQLFVCSARKPMSGSYCTCLRWKMHIGLTANCCVPHRQNNLFRHMIIPTRHLVC